SRAHRNEHAAQDGLSSPTPRKHWIVKPTRLASTQVSPHRSGPCNPGATVIRPAGAARGISRCRRRRGRESAGLGDATLGLWSGGEGGEGGGALSTPTTLAPSVVPPSVHPRFTLSPLVGAVGLERLVHGCR